MAKPSLLLADADPRSLRILELALRKAGFAVETAADGTQALQRVLASPPDVFVCEAALPSKDGLAVCRAVRASEALAGLPVIVTSADRSLAAPALEAGADEFLRKPILLRELVRRAQALVERRELARGAAADAITGSLRDLGLVDALQALLAARKSALVSCEAWGRSARVWVRDGQAVDAELGPLTGDAAFFRLMTWESGSFRIEPREVDREVRLEGGTEAALVEAMRRTDELGRASAELPMTTVLAVDFPQLAEELDQLPDEVNGVLRCFDGRRTLREAVDLSPVDDLGTLVVVRRLIDSGVLRAQPAPSGPKKPSLDQWLSDPPLPAAKPLVLVRYPPLRGVRRERLRREAEEARARIGAGKAVRLSRVVELPAYLPGGVDALEGARQMSPAVGEAARKFAPDAGVARVVGGIEEITVRSPPDVQAVATPPIAPVAEATPAPALSPDRAGPHIRRWAWSGAGAAALLALAVLLRPLTKGAPSLQPAPVAAQRAAPVQAKAPEPAVAQGPAQPQPQPAPPTATASELPYAKAMELGDDLLRRGRYKQAISQFQRAVRARPQAVPALLALGDAYLEADQPRGALQPLETAARLDPRSARAQLLLGTACQSLGKTAQSAKAYRRYLELEPQGEFARDVRLILANLAH